MSDDAAQTKTSDSFRLIFGRGLVVIVPLVITVWVLNMLFNAIDGIISPIFDHVLGRHIPGLGFVSMIILIVIIGALSRNLIGRAVFKYFERFIFSLPCTAGLAQHCCRDDEDSRADHRADHDEEQVSEPKCAVERSRRSRALT